MHGGQRKSSANDLRLGLERISTEYTKIKRDTDGPGGGLFGLVVSAQNPLGRHAFESALKLVENVPIRRQVGGRAEVDQLYREVDQVDQNVLGLDVAMDDSSGQQLHVDVYELSEERVKNGLA